MVRNQTINVHCGCKGGCGSCGKKKRRKASKRGGVNSNTKKTEAPSNYNPIHAFTPVYIQSGNPPPEPNPLLRAVQDLKERVDTHHDYYRNELRHRVHNVGRGNIAEPVREPVREHSVMETQTDYTGEIPQPSAFNTNLTTPIKTPKNLHSDYHSDGELYNAKPHIASRRLPIATPISSLGDLNNERGHTNWQQTGHGQYIPLAGGGGMGTDSINRGRQARPQGEHETDEQYRARMEKNKKAREKASEDRRNRNP